MRTFRPALAILLAAGTAAGVSARPGAHAQRLTDEMRSVYAEMFGDDLPTETLPSLQNRARVHFEITHQVCDNFAADGVIIAVSPPPYRWQLA